MSWLPSNLLRVHRLFGNLLAISSCASFSGCLQNNLKNFALNCVYVNVLHFSSLEIFPVILVPPHYRLNWLSWCLTIGVIAVSGFEAHFIFNYNAKLHRVFNKYGYDIDGKLSEEIWCYGKKCAIHFRRQSRRHCVKLCLCRRVAFLLVGNFSSNSGSATLQAELTVFLPDNWSHNCPRFRSTFYLLISMQNFTPFS